MGKYAFGIDIGGTTVKCGLFKADGILCDKWEIKTRTENHGNAILPDIAESILAKMKEKDIEQSDIIGIGVGVPGPVLKEREVEAAVNLHWGYTKLADQLEKLVGNIPVKVGNSVIQANNFNDGTTIASVADMNDMIFRGNVDETEIGRIHEGMPIKLTIGAMDSRTFDAQLEYVSPKGVDKNGAIQFEIKAAVEIPKDVFIRAGYSANAEIVLKKAENVLTIPESTVEFKGDSTFVYQITQEKPEQKFEKREIKIGLSDGINIEVKEGLTPEIKVRGAAIQTSK